MSSLTPDPGDAALGAAIRRRREAVELRQQEVAGQAGMLNTVLSRIERGARPCRATELRDIAAVLGTTADALLEEAVAERYPALLRRAGARYSAAVVALRDAVAAALRAAEVADESPEDVTAHIVGFGPHVDAPEWLRTVAAAAIERAVHSA